MTEEAQSPPSSLTQTTGSDVAVGAPEAAFDTFLDRLMRAESNGRSHAKNPRSSALGPFQFINSTFLAVMREHFPGDIARLTEGEILALRVDRDVARRAAEAFSKDNMAYLVDKGITPTFGHLRLAFLLGPQGAARVLQAPSDRRLTRILDDGVIAANPFMRRMTAADLIARATRDVSPRDRAPGEEVADSTPAKPAAQPEQQPEQPAPISVAVTEQAGPEAGVPAQIETPASDAARPEAPAITAVVKEVVEEHEAAKSAPTAEAAAPESGKRVKRRVAQPLVINVTCDWRQASCKRWVDQQVAKLLKIAEGGDARRDS